MLKYTVKQIDANSDDFIVSILDESSEYNTKFCKVTNLKVSEDNSLDFEIELPKTDETLFNDEKFLQEIEYIVGDIFKKSVDMIYEGQSQMLLLESKLMNVFELNNLKNKNTEKPLIQSFLEKGFLVIDSKDKESIPLTAVDMTTSKEYNLTNSTELKEIYDIVFPKTSSLIIQ